MKGQYRLECRVWERRRESVGQDAGKAKGDGPKNARMIKGVYYVYYRGRRKRTEIKKWATIGLMSRPRMSEPRVSIESSFATSWAEFPIIWFKVFRLVLGHGKERRRDERAEE